MTLIAAIPVPDLAVPYAAPRAVKREHYCNGIFFNFFLREDDRAA
jgi:hypothetical protein